MPTRRMIDPAIWQSETMADLTLEQRLLFIGLFSNADDQGRLRAHPSLIRSYVFPYDDIAIEKITDDLQAIANAGCIYLYDTDDKQYLQIVNWWKYQSPQWAYPSRIPPPGGWHDRLRYRQDNQVITDNWGNEALPNALAKDLPNGMAEGDGQADGWPDSIRVRNSNSSENSGADAPVSEDRDYVVDCVRFATERKGEKSWTVPEDAGGFDPFEDKPLKEFCTLINMPYEQLTDKKKESWSRQLRNIARSNEATADVVFEAIRALPQSEYSWLTPTDPFQKAFVGAVGVLSARIQAGILIDANPPTGPPPEPRVIHGIDATPEWLKGVPSTGPPERQVDG